MRDDGLEILTNRLHAWYKKYKRAGEYLNGEDKKKKDRRTGLKEDFFDVAAERVANVLARKTVVIRDAESSENAEYEAKLLNPRWLVFATNGPVGDGPGIYHILMEEDPYFKPFSYVNRDGIIFQKTIVDGTPWVDDEKLRRENIDLWRRVSRIDNHAFIHELLYHANIELDEIDDFIYDLELHYENAVTRTIIPLAEIQDEADVAELANYIYPGKPTVKLLPPRKAKPEELTNGRA